MMNHLLMILFTIHAGYSLKGGVPAEPREFKYVASIQRAKIHQCSGVIIDEKHIITLAHKIADFNAAELGVVVGITAISNRWGTRLPIEEVYLHPGFGMRNSIEYLGDTYYEHDIAVLRLGQSLIWNPFVSPVSLTHIEHSWGCHFECILISWDVPIDRRKRMVLKWEFIALMGNEVHQRWARYLGKDQKFFDDPYGAVVIGPEDLGSPIVCENSMSGLVVKEEQQTIPGKPSILISIAPYLEFIEDIVHDGLFEAEPGEFPYAASIWNNGIYICGGFIVDATHVATAGHCVVTNTMSDYRVIVGHVPQRFSLANITIHPNYEVKLTSLPPKWYIEHDFALFTLAKPILFDQRTNQLSLADSDDFHVGQVCKVLRWKYRRDEGTGVEAMILMTSRVIIVNHGYSQPQLDTSLQSQVPSFWGKSRYLIPIASQKDVGNPIICDGNPVGFLIQAIPFDGKSTAVLAKFLKIRPYIEFENSS